jgi:very-short-patch-repair endonuclease
MRKTQRELALLLREGGGLLCRRDHPDLATALDWQVRLGHLRPILPGVYLDPAADSLELRLRAVARWDPDAILTGAAAARITFWPQIRFDRVTAAIRSRKAVRPGFVFTRRRIPPELITEVQGVRCTTPALTALDLATTLGGNTIDTVLRTRAATLTQLHEAIELTPSRRGNVDRRVLLLDSRDEPWSEAERETHRLLRRAGIQDWKANYPFEMLSGLYWIDIAFPKLKLAIEIDGREFHEGEVVFESDRWRQNDLVLAGWRILRFTAKMIKDHPQIVLRLIERALAA